MCEAAVPENVRLLPGDPAARKTMKRYHWFHTSVWYISLAPGWRLRCAAGLEQRSQLNFISRELLDLGFLRGKTVWLIAGHLVGSCEALYGRWLQTNYSVMVGWLDGVLSSILSLPSAQEGLVIVPCCIYSLPALLCMARGPQCSPCSGRGV